jgi:hypothetical protein
VVGVRPGGHVTTPFAAWPPSLAALKRDLTIDDDADDLVLQDDLDAAVAYVERVHRWRFEFDPFVVFTDLRRPSADLVLGTIRLAGRWFHRRRSPDGMVNAGDLGTTNVPGIDSDIERQLEIGRFGGSVIV